MHKTVLFDLDNTLTDRRGSISVYAESFIQSFPGVLQKWSTEELATNIAVADNGGYVQIDSLHDSVYIAIASHLKCELQDCLSASQEDIEQHWKEHFPRCSIEMAGASDLLEVLSGEGFTIGVVSNGRQVSRESTVEALPVSHTIDFVLSSEMAGIKKPSRDIFEMAIKMAKTSPSDCWFVGDHPNNDVIGAENAGIRAIWLSGFHSWPKVAPNPTFHVNSLSQAPLLIGLKEHSSAK